MLALLMLVWSLASVGQALYLHPFPLARVVRYSATSSMSEKVERRRKLKELEKVDYIVDGNSRTIIPYVHEFTTFAKGRWYNREILEVLSKEYGGMSKEYWENSLKYGHVRVNDQIVSPTYKFKNGDAMLHRKHRHEPPVHGRITLVGENEHILAVSKPPSMPMHPCGAYRHNSLTMILKSEPIIPNQPELYLIHRLDRVTSGLVILAKNKEIASKLASEIRGRETKKTYLARVKGKFPGNISHIKQIQDSSNLFEVHDVDDDNEDTNEDNNAEPVSAKRIRLDNDTLSPDESQNTSVSYSIPSFVEVGKSDKVGYTYTESVFILKCPVGVVSYRDGIHACRADGKVSISAFKPLAYDATSDTSLVECRPITGRTHQLRLHLQFLDNPIANDPCYGGEIFFGNQSKKKQAVELLTEMYKAGVIPLTKVPHINDPALVELHKHAASRINNHKSATEINDFNCQKKDESDNDFLVRTCKYCSDDKSIELENILHCDGIWLHALKYSGDDWSFSTEFPDWAKF